MVLLFINNKQPYYILEINKQKVLYTYDKDIYISIESIKREY